uniref:Uncharacterized protein n=1 Tax=Tetradesmus obliquus TaxID=3088 RepID=A0A383WGW8_TETOB
MQQQHQQPQQQQQQQVQQQQQPAQQLHQQQRQQQRQQQHDVVPVQQQLWRALQAHKTTLLQLIQELRVRQCNVTTQFAAASAPLTSGDAALSNEHSDNMKAQLLQLQQQLQQLEQQVERHELSQTAVRQQRQKAQDDLLSLLQPPGLRIGDAAAALSQQQQQQQQQPAACNMSV